jgi:hypothetical protein
MTMSQITNKKQLKIAEDKIKDLAELIIKTYSNRPIDEPKILNAAIGGNIRRMSTIQEDIYQFLRGVK